MSQTYTYSLANDFPGGQINSAALEVAINESTISTPLVEIDVNGDVVNIVFSAALSAGDKTTLDGNQSHPAGGLIASTPTAQFISESVRFGIIGYGKGLNMNSTSDQPIFMLTNRYIVRRVTAANVSQALLVAAGGIYSATGKGGNVYVPATQLYTSLSAAHKYIDLTLTALVQSNIGTKQECYFSLTVPEVTPCTMDIVIWGDDYSGLTN